MRLRTVPEAYRELKKEDPNTAFTLSALRRLVKLGAVPVVLVGNKRLVDLDKLPDQLLAIPVEVPAPVRLGVYPIGVK